MRIFKTKWFARFTRQEGISDGSLREAIRRAESGLVGADLGGGLIKLRVARRGEGRSGGYRVIVAYRFRHVAVFFLGFAKSEQENIEPAQLIAARRFAAKWTAAKDEEFALAMQAGELQEVINGQETESGNRSAARNR